MSLVTVEVLAQYFDENGKPKGGQKFILKADADEVMYAPKADVTDILQLLIDDKMKGYAGRHQCVDFNLIFQDDIQLDNDRFETLLDEFYNKKG